MSAKILIAGSTGNIGRKLVTRVLTEDKAACLVLLVRGDSVTHARSRIEGVLQTLLPDAGLTELLRAYCGRDLDQR
jgi:thioester reductase-like protein